MISKLFKQVLNQQQFLEYTQQVQSQQKTLHEKIEIVQFIGQQQLNKDVFVQKMINQCKNSYPAAFKFEFLPVDTNDQVQCDNCKISITHHFKCKPCSHTLCQSCFLHCMKFENDIKCYYCKESIEDVFVDPVIIKQQLETKVHCLHNASENVDFTLNVSKLCTKDNNILNIPNNILNLQQRFNKNQINLAYLNQMKTEQITQLHENRVSQEISSQINGKNHIIEFFQHSEQTEQVIISGCSDTFQYKNVIEHERHCQQAIQCCIHCNVQLPRQIMQKHLVNCIRKSIACPVCYYEQVTVDSYNDHVINCLHKIELLEKEKVAKPYEQQADIDMQLKVQRLETLTDKLTNYILQQDSILQDQILNRIKMWSGSGQMIKKQKSKFKQWVDNFYMVNYINFCMSEAIICTCIQEIVARVNPHIQFPISITIMILQCLNIVLYIVHFQYYMKQQEFRHTTILILVKQYIACVILFSSCLTTLKILQPDSIYANGFDNTETYIIQPLKFFALMLYYVQLHVSAKVGFGDVRPIQLTAKLATIVMLYYTTYIVLIWFRGISFMIKLQNVNRYNDRIEQKAKQHRQKVINY